MEIKSDNLKIHVGALRVDGQKAEPEELPAERILSTELPMTGAGAGRSLAGEVIYSGSVADFAFGARRQCMHCRFFNAEAWRKTKDLWERGTLEQRGWLNGARARLASLMNSEVIERHIGQDGDMDVEHALNSLGICRALTEIDNDVRIVYPISACPPETIGPANPQGLFKPKDREAANAASDAFDRIMMAAVGK